jgi:hypothetical protein
MTRRILEHHAAVHAAHAGDELVEISEVLSLHER